MADKFTELYAFVATDETGDEGVIAFPFPSGIMPLIAGDMERVESIRSLAQRITDERGIPTRLVHFTNLEDVEVLEPSKED